MFHVRQKQIETERVIIKYFKPDPYIVFAEMEAEPDQVEVDADAGDIDDVCDLEIDMTKLSDRERSLMFPSEGTGAASVFTPRALLDSTECFRHESDFKLVPKITIADNTAEVFCLRFSPDGKFLAAGCGDGAVRVFSSQTGKLAYNLQSGSNVALPTTCIRFRPITPTTRTKVIHISCSVYPPTYTNLSAYVCLAGDVSIYRTC